ncbi:thioesterase II family protein [Streptomyces subrutilus]|uniref:Thioesterase n=1 Tax=Streptomyces subrutilus TaxID=36818 RepID=A0A5P2UVE4_9ACTN|nr:alpha/beta fold hydrolase [Streptomyces subrutilus]QEU82309.1 thioesterase [Streptomyces subrutilus]WSJ28241.1 alpha/beta fold hydrolase [Streptomyces subrutilus]GGZ69811.1 thioesterase [Streptomyces subrutilus]
MGTWISTWTTDPAYAALPALLCLPPAGAGCQQFRSWQGALSGTAQVYGVQLPGRENRWREPMPDSFDEAVAAVAAELGRTVAADRPLVVFGHSFGGLIGYEVARRVRPRALVVSGCRAPGHWDGAGRGIVDDADELDKLFDTAGLDPELLDDDTRALMVAMLRKDAALSLGYVHQPAPRLDVPVHAWGADGDETVSAAELDGWAAVTTAGLTRHTTTGGHHAVLRDPRPVLDQLTGLLRGEHAPLAPTP